MASGQPIPVPPNLPKLWLTVLRIAVGASILEFLLFVLSVPSPILVLCALVYALTLFGLFTGLTDFAARTARALSFFLFPATTVYMLAIAFDETLPGVAPRLVMALAAATQFAVVYSSSQVCQPPRGKKKEKGRDWEAFAQKAFPVVVIVGAFILIILVFFSSQFGMTRPDRAKVWAIQSLYRVSICAQAYSAAHEEQGFPSSLEAMGPAEFDCVPEEILATGASDSFNFVYVPGEPDRSGRIVSFAVIARTTGAVPGAEYSYLMDDSGLIHYTDENRDPTPDDPTF